MPCLLTGTNGNLVASANGTNVTYMGDAGVDYYYEADGTGAVHTGGTAFSSTSGVTYNFGQQPFASQLDSSQVWSGDLSCSAGFTSTGPAVNAFDGSLTSSAVGNSTNAAIVFTTTNFPAASGPYSVAVYADSKHAVTINGAATVKDSGTGAIAHRSNGTVTELTEIVIPDSVVLRSDIAAIEVNGKILIDSDAAIAEAYGNNLYQTWLEWNDVATFRADNPADVATFNTIKAALEAYEPEVATSSTST